MIYPRNFEHKIGFDEVRTWLRSRCRSTLGQERADELAPSTEAATVDEWLRQTADYRRLQQAQERPEMNFFFDVRQAVSRLRTENTHLEVEELWDLRRSLETIGNMVDFLTKESTDRQQAANGRLPETTDDTQAADDGTSHPYPALWRMTVGVATFPAVIRRIDSVLDKFGQIKDSASMTLAGIRHDMEQTAGSISRTLYTILHTAQRGGIVAQDAAPTLRDGRLMIPVAPGQKRRINGIVHDESATGKTVFIEPAEVVEANNRIRELEAQERREIIRILTVISDELRPQVDALLQACRFLADVDLVSAKAAMADEMQAIEPHVTANPALDWRSATHPLLARSLKAQDKAIVPLDIYLKRPDASSPEQAARGGILVISGPNAGGKSVCLKTVGLLQYMLQCGLSIPVGDRSEVGIFRDIMIDIGDEQSISDDLSTYSSHLQNMKQMMRQASPQTLLLIDEFGGGTEPTIGGAMAEAMLRQFWKHGAYAVITTHYQNLKHFADDHPGVTNGAMLYDRHRMQSLFQLSIGQPGSSFAIEIARQTGIPEEVISDASDIVGQDYIQSDKYLQDIVRDKRYWEGKRQTIHQHEKSLEGRIQRYETSLEEIERQRRQILQRAQQQAEELLSEANRRIENAIREIKEAQAEKEKTRLIREELQEFRQEVQNDDTRGLMSEEDFARRLQKMEERKARKAKRKAERDEQQQAVSQRLAQHAKASADDATRPLQPGDHVRIKGTQSIGQIDSLQGRQATVIFGGLRSKVKLEQLERSEPSTTAQVSANAAQRHAHLAIQTSRMTRSTIEDRRQNFHQDLDVRGMRGDEAVDAVMHFIDDAILMGMSRVRILHGTGTGILRQLIRQYLATVPNVRSARDEHVQFGGAGITVVDIE